MRKIDVDLESNGHTLGKETELPSAAAQQLVAYEEARAAGMAGDRLVGTFLLDAEQARRLVEDAACIDLLHRMWPEFEAAVPRPGMDRRPETFPRLGDDLGIVREIAHGGMGAVYEARQLSLGRRVAVKVLPFGALASEQQVRRFQNEARAAATLQHPHIVPVYAVGCEGRAHYYTMQYIDGPSLADVLEVLRADDEAHERQECKVDVKAEAVGGKTETGSLAAESTRKSAADGREPLVSRGGVEPPVSGTKDNSPCESTTLDVARALLAEHHKSRSAYCRTIARWGVQLAEALAYAHENGVLHRDIKPANILLDAAGRPWITDFGLARLETEATLTKTGELVGTLRYMAPEQARGKRGAVGPAADVYSLGVTLYELLTLRPAFRGHDRAALLKQIVLDEPLPPRRIDRSIPRDLETIVRKSISKDVSDRYDSARELAADLQRFLDQEPILAKPQGPMRRAVKWSRRRPTSAALIAVSILAIVGLWGGTVWHAHTLAAALDQSNEQRHRAEASEQSALQRARELRNLHYATRMKAAGEAWDNRNAAFLRELISDRDEASTDLRGFEWHFLRKLYASSGHEFVGHTEQVNGVAYFPDDKLLATASDDGTVKIWRTDTHELIKTLRGHSSCVNEVHIAPDGKWFATASCDRTVKIWDAASLSEIATLGPHERGVACLAISPDSRAIATGLLDVDKLADTPQGRAAVNSIVVWDVVTRRQMGALSGHEENVDSLAFQPDGAVLASASLDSTVRTWDIKNSRPLQVLRGHLGGVYCARFSPDGAVLASGDYFGTTIIWDLATGRPKTMMRRRNSAVSLAFSPDSATLATGHRDGFIELWDAASGQSKGARLADNHTIQALEFSHDGQWLASGARPHTARIWRCRCEPGVVLTIERQNVHAMKVSFDDRLHRCILADAGCGIEGWNLETGAVINSFRGRRLKRILPFDPFPMLAPSGDFLATAGYPDALQFWDLKQRKSSLCVTLRDDRGTFLGAEFLGNDHRLLGFVQQDTEPATWAASIWDTSQSKPLEDVVTGRGPLTAFAVHPCHTAFALCTDLAPVVYVYELPTGRLLARLEGHSARITQLGFSLDGSQILSAAEDGTAVLWDWAKSAKIQKLAGHEGPVHSAAFSPDGRTLATGDNSGSVRLWSAASGQATIRLRTKYAGVLNLRFSSDGKRLACLSANRLGTGPEYEVRVWSIE